MGVAGPSSEGPAAGVTKRRGTKRLFCGTLFCGLRAAGQRQEVTAKCRGFCFGLFSLGGPDKVSQDVRNPDDDF